MHWKLIYWFSHTISVWLTGALWWDVCVAHRWHDLGVVFIALRAGSSHCRGSTTNYLHIQPACQVHNIWLPCVKCCKIIMWMWYVYGLTPAPCYTSGLTPSVCNTKQIWPRPLYVIYNSLVYSTVTLCMSYTGLDTNPCIRYIRCTEVKHCRRSDTIFTDVVKWTGGHVL